MNYPLDIKLHRSHRYQPVTYTLLPGMNDNHCHVGWVASDLGHKYWIYKNDHLLNGEI